AWAATGRDRQYRRHCQNRAVKWGTFPATASLKENRPMTSTLSEDRYFEPARRDLARRLYDTVKHLPLICPHGHVDPAMLAAPHYDYGSPVDLLIIPDHYIFRMLYSHGIALEALGIPRLDGQPVEQDHRRIWQVVADHWHLFRGT